jgi:hypothetical protein
MPVSKGKNCVGDELSRFKKGELHSGKSGKIVTNPKQAKAIALSACGQSKYAEQLQSMGYSEETATKVTEMLYGESPDWKQQFKTGDPGKNNPQNYKVDPWFVRNDQSGRPLDIDSRPGKQKGDMGKQKDNESGMISGVALPKGPGNPQGGSSKEVQGLRMLG